MRIVRLFPILFALVACKQGEGERCQIRDDCEGDLVCSSVEPRMCLLPGTENTTDAGATPDSRFDARVADADTAPTPDAPSTPDAPGTPDAAAPDAAEADAP